MVEQVLQRQENFSPGKHNGTIIFKNLHNMRTHIGPYGPEASQSLWWFYEWLSTGRGTDYITGPASGGCEKSWRIFSWPLLVSDLLSKIKIWLQTADWTGREESKMDKHIQVGYDSPEGTVAATNFGRTIYMCFPCWHQWNNPGTLMLPYNATSELGTMRPWVFCLQKQQHEGSLILLRMITFIKAQEIQAYSVVQVYF